MNFSGDRNPRKIKVLLKALDKTGRGVDYFAVDLFLPALQRSLDRISASSFQNINCYGLLGTYDDARAWLQLPENIQRPKCLVSLGSSIGNLSHSGAAEFLSGFAQVLGHKRGPSENTQENPDEVESSMLIGLDSCKSADKIYPAYSDPYGVNAQFILNLLEHANSVLSYEAFRLEEWKVLGVWNETTGCFTQNLVPLKNVTFDDVNLKSGEAIPVTQSYKYDGVEKARLWKKAGLKEVKHWRCKDRSYGETCSLPSVHGLSFSHP